MTRSEAVQDIIDLLREEADADRDPEATPEVGIIMGSDSDLDTMYGAYEALTELGFAEVTDYDDPPEARFTFETYVVSAHRTPELLYTYGETARERGLDVVIAGAGGKSADLPNMAASIAYPLPVVGVPVQEKSVDSVVGMPTDQRDILEVLRDVPYGENVSVDALARTTPGLDPDNEEADQLVRTVLAENPAPLVIPDHRVRDGPSAAPPPVERRLRAVEGL